MPKRNGFGLKSYARRPGARATPRKVPHSFGKYLPQLCGLSDSSNQALDLSGWRSCKFPSTVKAKFARFPINRRHRGGNGSPIRARELRGLWLKYNSNPIDYS